MNDQILLRVPEVASRLGLARSTVYLLISTGALRSILVGRSRRVPVAEVERWVEEQLKAALHDRRVIAEPDEHGDVRLVRKWS